MGDNLHMSAELLVGVLSLIAAVLALPKIGVKRFFIWAGATVVIFSVWSYFKKGPSVVGQETNVSDTERVQSSGPSREASSPKAGESHQPAQESSKTVATP